MTPGNSIRAGSRKLLILFADTFRGHLHERLSALSEKLRQIVHFIQPGLALSFYDVHITDGRLDAARL